MALQQITQKKVVRLYQKRFSRLRYFRQDNNLGIDRDFANAVNLAQGEYCWLFSDDDVLKPGAIQTVLEALQVNYSLVIINSEVRSGDLCTVLQSKRLPFEENRLYRPCDHDRLLIEVANYLTFIGCVVIKRALWNAQTKRGILWFVLHSCRRHISADPSRRCSCPSPAIDRDSVW